MRGGGGQSNSGCCLFICLFFLQIPVLGRQWFASGDGGRSEAWFAAISLILRFFLHIDLSLTASLMFVVLCGQCRLRRSLFSHPFGGIAGKKSVCFGLFFFGWIGLAFSGVKAILQLAGARSGVLGRLWLKRRSARRGGAHRLRFGHETTTTKWCDKRQRRLQREEVLAKGAPMDLSTVRFTYGFLVLRLRSLFFFGYAREGNGGVLRGVQYSHSLASRKRLEARHC